MKPAVMIFIGLAISRGAFALPQYFTEKVDQVPNICQSCFPELIQWGGKPHCAPAAVSNSLVWLSQNGFEALQPFHTGDLQKDQAQLVNLLGQTMETTQNAGTSPFKILTGLKKYLDFKNVKFKRIAATGWRSIPPFAHLDGVQTKLEWIKEGTLGKNSVWILIGWSKYDPLKDHYKIYDGHWMTVVGYGKNRQGQVDPHILIVHDPAERSERKNYYATVSVLEKGTIDNSIPAHGILTLQGDVVLKPGADAGLIQGAYRLEF
jgi:hypothetical protein